MELKAMSRYLRFCAVACLAAFGLAASEHHGLVKFGSLPIPGATVTATKGDKKVVAITDDAGIYAFPDLEDGTWKIQVDMLAFTSVTKDIGVAPNAPGAEWELKLMSMDEIKPTAQGAAPPPSAPATSAAAPPSGATPPPAAAGQSGPPATPSINQSVAAANANAPKPPAKGKNGKNAAPTTPANGFQRTDVNASGDGAAASSTPAIASAEQTQTASDAFVVNGSTSNGIERRAIGNGRKGPRSLFNGQVDFRIDNDVIDARNYSLTGQDTPRSPYNRFTIAAGFGGPLWVPHVFRWAGNFFINFQTTRNRNANNSTATFPTDAERNGDFSQVAGITLKDPTTGNPIPTGVVPPSAISQQAKYLLTFYPHPQFVTNNLGYNYQIPLVNRAITDQFSTRVNKTINNKSSINTQFGYQRISNSNNNLYSFVDTTATSNYRGFAQYNRNFTRTLYGNFNVEYTRSSALTTPFFANKTNISGAAGITGNDQSPLDWGPPSLSFSSGISGLSDGNSNFARNQTTAFSTTMTYIRRPHTFKFGADVKFQDITSVGQQNGRGGFGFNTPASLTGFDFADFLYGIPTTASLAFGNADKYLSDRLYDVWLTDDWRVSPSLSLTLGLRWDYGTPATEEYGRLVNLDVAPGFVASAPVIAYSPKGPLSNSNFSDALLNPDKHQVQPRLAFAWKPIFGASTLVRGGFGVYYNTGAYTSLARSMWQLAPLSKTLSVANSAATPLTLANGFLPSTSQTATTYGIDPNYRVGYSQNWYLSVQQNVTASLVATAQYSGVKGTRVAQEFQPNTYPDAQWSPVVIPPVNPCPTCLPGYTYLTSNGNSTKHAGTLTLRRRFHGGLQTTGTYVYSKAIDDAGGIGSATGSIAQNWRNLAAERGLSSFDQRHLLQVQVQYSTGVGVRGGALLTGWRGLILKGWTFLSNINVGSGTPFTPTFPLSSPLTGTTLRPEYTGANVYAAPAGLFLNPAAYIAPLPGQYGNAARDSLIGPNQFTFNGSMQRSFADNISFRFDASNILNHPTFGAPNSTFNPTLPNGGQFGIRGNPSGMRQLTASFHWTF